MGVKVSLHPGMLFLTCRRCGPMKLSGTVEATLRTGPLHGRAAANASAWIREHPNVSLKEKDLEQLQLLRAPSVSERAMKVLQDLERRYPNVGATFSFSFPEVATSNPDWLSISWSESAEELQYLVVTYLHDSLSAIKGVKSTTLGRRTDLTECRISPRGYELLDQLRQGKPNSEIGFCAMWFSDELTELWTKAIEPAIRAAGYKPVRIDQHEHVNRIDDEIVSMIRRSGFVVADFTGQRGGVYFEAGYALGHGLRVIWTCREDDLKNVHFDTRQYNFLPWTPGNYGDLATRLQNRIEATLGRGPVKNG